MLHTNVFALGLLCLLAACAGDADGGAAPDAGGGDASAWIGNWSTTGTQSTTCGGGTGTSQLSGLVVISEGPKADTIVTDSGGCRLVWDLDGATAALEGGQVCTVSVNGASFTVSWTQSAMSLHGTTITGTTTGAANNGCSFMQQVTLTASP
jgi:hypothetical protein